MTDINQSATQLNTQSQTYTKEQLEEMKAKIDRDIAEYNRAVQSDENGKSLHYLEVGNARQALIDLCEDRYLITPEGKFYDYNAELTREQVYGLRKLGLLDNGGAFITEEQTKMLLQFLKENDLEETYAYDSIEDFKQNYQDYDTGRDFTAELMMPILYAKGWISSYC